MNARPWAEWLARRLDEALLRDLGTDPQAGIRTHFPHLLVKSTAVNWNRGHGGMCDGMYLRTREVILYAPTLGSRRANFTLLHELAHHLVYGVDDLLSWAADHPERERVIEDVCNHFAAIVLVPDALIQDVLGTGKPAAHHVKDLYERSSASREVCAIAIARRLGCEGFVALIDRTEGRVMLGSRVADTRPYAWRDDMLPFEHPLAQLGTGQQIRDLSWWPFPSGEKREYWMDATATDRSICAIFATIDLWEMKRLHILEAPPEMVERPISTVHCRSCGYRGPGRGFPCPDCHQPDCPRCKKCECDRRREASVSCSRCFVSVERRRLRNGVCNDCVGRSPLR